MFGERRERTAKNVFCFLLFNFDLDSVGEKKIIFLLLFFEPAAEARAASRPVCRGRAPTRGRPCGGHGAGQGVSPQKAEAKAKARGERELRAEEEVAALSALSLSSVSPSLATADDDDDDVDVPEEPLPHAPRSSRSESGW